jgi:hypothetical protein
MEELKRLAILYYKDVVRLKYFGFKGFVLIIISIPLLCGSFVMNFTYKLGNVSNIPFFITAFLWIFAKKEYDKNLIKHLAFYTHQDNVTASEQKALYLQSITSHISSSLFETLKIFKEIIETDKKHKTLVFDNLGYYFINFLYNPDAKSRILSLSIYLISLVALLVVIKPSNEIEIYSILESFSFNGIVTYFSLCIFMILLGFFIVVAPITFLYSFVITPIFLKMLNTSMLNKYFISELNKHSLLEINAANKSFHRISQTARNQ